MPKSPRVDNSVLLDAGMELMKQVGKPLSKIASTGRSMLYSLPNDETVRVRTCNDHILIVVADNPSKDAKLNIEGTEWLLVIMPEIERTPGNVIAYLIPTKEAVEAARQTHSEWLASNPRTKGENTTWNLWFKPDAPGKANNFAVKWANYRINGKVEINKKEEKVSSTGVKDVRTEVENARRRISEAAGVPIEAVKITIDFSL